MLDGRTGPVADFSSIKDAVRTPMTTAEFDEHLAIGGVISQISAQDREWLRTSGLSRGDAVLVAAQLTLAREAGALAPGAGVTSTWLRQVADQAVSPNFRDALTRAVEITQQRELTGGHRVDLNA